MIIEQCANFQFYKENGAIVLFYKNGSIAYENLSQKISTESPLTFGNLNKALIHEFLFDEDLYIKILPVGRLFKVVAVREERYFERKI